MAQLAIQGHADRGDEVIKILELLGGKNFNHNAGNYKWEFDYEAVFE